MEEKEGGCFRQEKGREVGIAVGEQDDVARELAKQQWAAMATILYGDSPREPYTEEKGDRIAIHATFEAVIKVQAALVALDQRLARVELLQQKRLELISRQIPQRTADLALAIASSLLRTCTGTLAVCAGGYMLSRWIWGPDLPWFALGIAAYGLLGWLIFREDGRLRKKDKTQMERDAALETECRELENPNSWDSYRPKPGEPTEGA